MDKFKNALLTATKVLLAATGTLVGLIICLTLAVLAVGSVGFISVISGTLLWFFLMIFLIEYFG